MNKQIMINQKNMYNGIPTIDRNRVSREKLNIRHMVALKSVRFVVISHIYT